MKKHSFQKGDRVVGLGVKGVYERPYGDIDDNEHLIRRDDGEAEAHAPFWWFDGVDLQHDRDFHVADLVRYECVKPMPRSHLLRDGMQGKVVECLNETVSVQFSEHGGLFVLKDNLVKIAPPAEENVSETVTIEHDQWGRVEGVYNANSVAFFKKERGVEMWYNKNEGWREVKPTRWVPMDYEIQREGKTLVAWVNASAETYPMHFHLGKGYRWKTVEIEREVEG